MSEKLLSADGISIEEIRSAAAGDHEVFRVIAEKSAPLIQSILSRIVIPANEKDDLKQEALIGLYKAVMLYDAHCSSFATFSYICIRRTVLSALKKYNNKNNSLLRNSLSLSDSSDDPNDPLIDFPSHEGDPEQILVDRENHARFLSRLDSELSNYEQNVLKLYLSDCTHEQIALTLHVSPKSVSNALQRIRNKLKLRD